MQLVNEASMTSQDKSCWQLATHSTRLSGALVRLYVKSFQGEADDTFDITCLWSRQTRGTSSTSIPWDCNNNNVVVFTMLPRSTTEDPPTQGTYVRHANQTVTPGMSSKKSSEFLHHTVGCFPRHGLSKDLRVYEESIRRYVQDRNSIQIFVVQKKESQPSDQSRQSPVGNRQYVVPDDLVPFTERQKDKRHLVITSL
ncbi:hypothetical protein FF38_10536 [Lucilia cuprina]|uniref:Uncharacterized protein n=1 Tax=Lucilia cuprina TaxID=7375 RepID=A0A0L0BWT5_LUCCU|nr:hypothetical protein FF38_10536 [Lucilia cuprina]